LHQTFSANITALLENYYNFYILFEVYNTFLDPFSVISILVLITTLLSNLINLVIGLVHKRLGLSTAKLWSHSVKSGSFDIKFGN